MNKLPKKQLLCFGDSNTWGYVPNSGDRFPPSVRWTGILHKHLGSNYFLIEHAVSGRSAHNLMPANDQRNGQEQLEAYLNQHPTPAITAIMLGTNDIFNAPDFSARTIAKQLIGLALLIQQKNLTADSDSSVVLISPPPVNPNMEPSYYYQSHIRKSQELSGHLLELAIQADIPFINAADVAQGSEKDGIHLTAESHMQLGSFIFDEFKRLSLIS